MKIKIKNYNNQNNILNESEDKKPSAFDMFEANVQYQYILQRKKEALPVSIVFPMGFDKPLRLPTPPEDISNIMASYQNNKARKTKNIGGVMQDPIQTFNMADACCRDAFGNFSEISFEADAEKRKLNRSDIIDNNKSNESYNYEEFPVLNEAAVGAGLGAGLVLGNLASMGVQAGIGFTAGLAATVGANIALIGTGAYLTGYYGEELFGNVDDFINIFGFIVTNPHLESVYECYRYLDALKYLNDKKTVKEGNSFDKILYGSKLNNYELQNLKNILINSTDNLEKALKR